MRSSDLSREQLEKLAETLRQIHVTVGKLKKRLEAIRFPDDDRLNQLAVKASGVMQELWMHTHYLSADAKGRDKKDEGRIHLNFKSGETITTLTDTGKRFLVKRKGGKLGFKGPVRK